MMAGCLEAQHTDLGPGQPRPSKQHLRGGRGPALGPGRASLTPANAAHPHPPLYSPP